MKYKILSLSFALVLCSCTEPGDVVTGHARIVSWPPQAVAPAPQPVVVTPAPAPQTPPASKPVPEPTVRKAPTAPVAVPGAQYVVQHHEPAPAAAQKQPRVLPPAPAPAPQPAPYTQPQPVAQAVSIYQSTDSSPVAQNQPATTPPPGVQWHTPQLRPQKKKYPIMPGQNRGLRNRNYTHY